MRYLVWVALAVGCDGTEKDGTTSGVTFTQINTEILGPSCALAGCHADGTVNGMVLAPGAEYDALVDAPSIGSVGQTLVIPADADGSYVVLKLEDAVGITGTAMPPPFGGLDPADIQTIRDWIDAGALDN